MVPCPKGNIGARDRLTALCRKPVIAGLTGPLVGVGEEEWNRAVAGLVELGLVSEQDGALA